MSVKPKTTASQNRQIGWNARPDSEFQVVERLEDIPPFANEGEEHQFWSTHRFSDALLAEARPVPLEGDEDLPPARAETLGPRTRPIAIRLDRDVLRRLRAVAGKKNKGYQTLLKEFVLERLYEEEKREGLLAR